MVTVGKAVNDNLYFITVNGMTDILSEEAACNLIDILMDLISPPEGDDPTQVDGGPTVH